MADSNDEGRPPRFLGPGYDFSAFHLVRADLRWLATLLAVASAGLLIWAIAFDDDPAIYFPVVLRGPIALAAIAAALLVWSLLAVVNWVNWFRRPPDRK